MCKSNNKTEHHKSKCTSKNLALAGYLCKLCPRKFKSEVNLTLHIYWHTIETQASDDVDFDEPMGNYDNEDEGQFRFTASPGWVYNFLKRHELGKLKMKGEKGSADHDAVTPWVLEWLTFLHTEYVLKYQKTLQQVKIIIVNFDECGF